MLLADAIFISLSYLPQYFGLACLQQTTLLVVALEKFVVHDLSLPEAKKYHVVSLDICTVFVVHT